MILRGRLSPISVSSLIVLFLIQVSAITYRNGDTPDRGYKAFSREYSIDPLKINEEDNTGKYV